MSPFVGWDGPVRETSWGRVWLWFSSEGFCLFACSSKPNCLDFQWLKSLSEEGQTPKGPGLVVVDKNLVARTRGLQGLCCDKHNLITPPHPADQLNIFHFSVFEARAPLISLFIFLEGVSELLLLVRGSRALSGGRARPGEPEAR